MFKAPFIIQTCALNNITVLHGLLLHEASSGHASLKCVYNFHTVFNGMLECSDVLEKRSLSGKIKQDYLEYKRNQPIKVNYV